MILRPRSAVSGLLTLAILGCADTTAPARRPNVVWVVVDSLRADHLGCYGYERDTSPAIDAFADTGVLFQRAFATASWTMPSVASMFSGLHPTSHGVTGSAKKLPQELDTLTEILKAHGYRTAAVVSHYLVGSRYDFTQGFDVFHEEDAGDHRTVSTAGVTEKSLRLLEELRDASDPFFLWLHYFDPHYDYVDHDEYDWAPPTAGKLKGRMPIWKLRRMMDTLTEEEIQLIEARYDEEIRFTDRGIGEVLRAIEELGLEDDTIVFFMADHGEEFLGHGWLGHTRSLYQEVVRVPLIVRVPGTVGPRRDQVPVSLLGLTPTVLELLGIDLPKGLQGESFAARLTGEGTDEDELVYVEVDFEDHQTKGAHKTAHKKAVIGPRYKLIRDDVSGGIELYDLREDPNETKNLAQGLPGIATEMSAQLETHMARIRGEARTAEDIVLTPEEIERMQQLGYMGTDGEEGEAE